jgi:hypothetical protein
MKRLLYPNSACLLLLISTLFPAANCIAAFGPIAITADSYNQDVIVEKSGPPPLIPVTTASMETGLTNTGLSYYERGFNDSAPSTGVPAAGVAFNSQSDGNHDFQLGPTYKTNNAVLIDSNLTTGTLTLISPAAYGQLSFLVASGNGAGQAQFIIRYQDSTSQTGTVSCPDWFTALNAAAELNGRVDVTTFNFDSVNSGHPGLFSRDFTLSNSLSPVTRIDFAYVSGANHCAVFAISGAANVGDYFFPVTVRGYNADLIVEATATRRGGFNTATTATVERGGSNGGKTFFEQGYYSPAPSVGLPPPGSTLTNAAAPDHRYSMAGSYSNNNVVMVDADSPAATITLATPAAYGGLSLLCAAGNGPVTNRCVIHHANGISETNVFVVSDWLSNSVAAFSLNGRVNIDNRVIDQLNGGFPRLFACDFAVTNTSNPITNVVLNSLGGSSSSHLVVFAISGAPPGVTVTQAVLSFIRNPNGTLTLFTTQPGQLQSTTAFQGTNTAWQNLGPIVTTTDIVPTNSSGRSFYRVSSP